MNLLKKYKKTLVLVAVVATGAMFVSTDYNKYFEISKNLEIFANIYKELNTSYVDEIDPAKLMRTGVDAMLESLDPYTNYISESEIAGFRLQVTGRYGGIGASIRQFKDHDYVVITEPYEGFPAEKAGLIAGDEIISIAGKTAKGKTTKEVSDILKGAPGDEVTIMVRRPGTAKDFEVTVKREEVKIPNVPYFGMIDDETAYVTLTTFTERAGANVGDAIKKLQKDNDVKSIILDLRGNGGGLLKEAVNLSNIFVDKGEEVVTTRSRNVENDRSFRTLNSPLNTEIPLVVLINGSSASASEIVSGVIQDLDRGILVGQESFGKGLVQNTRPVGYDSKLKLTTAKYYIPSGRCIQAISYKDGKSSTINDSLHTEFKTRIGRSVFDGAGVKPDIEIVDPFMSNVEGALLSKNIIFDYATQYKLKNAEIAPASEYAFSDADFKDFEQFVAKQNMEYKTASEKELKQLEEKAKKENYYDAIKTDLEAMKRKIDEDKKKDLYKHKDRITRLIEQEIVKRYYYQKGGVEVGLKGDPYIKAALKVLKDKQRYQSILK